MNTNYPDSLYDYYRSNPSVFEERVNTTKRAINYALIVVCVLLLIFPSIIPIGNWFVRIVAVIALIYFGFSAFFGGKDFYNKASGGKIKEAAIRVFRYPFFHNVGGYTQADSENDIARIKQLFDNDDFTGLADEPAEKSGPLKLYIHEDATGKTFYLQLRYYFSSSDFRGISDVKVITEPKYSEVYQIIKSIKTIY
jgi:hypothetical protein